MCEPSAENPGGFAATESRIREMLTANPRTWVGDLDPRRPQLGSEPLKDAAVLVLLERRPGYGLVLTRRTLEVEHHKGEVSFAGGAADPTDADAVATALREAHEEIGLAPADVHVLGCLDRLVTVTGYAVTPVVGAVDAGYPFRRQIREVAHILHVPVPFLRDPTVWFEDERVWRGRRYRLRSCRWQDDVIWGATSRIIQCLLARIPATVLG